MKGRQHTRECGWEVDWAGRGLAVSSSCLRNANILSQTGYGGGGGDSGTNARVACGCEHSLPG
eukprot:5462803-Pyramimonas_sp.AAC.1